MHKNKTGLSMSYKLIALFSITVFCISLAVSMEDFTVREVAISLARAKKHYLYGLFIMAFLFTPRTYLISGGMIGLLLLASILLSFPIVTEYNFKSVFSAFDIIFRPYVLIYLIYIIFSFLIKYIVLLEGNYSKWHDIENVRKLYRR